MLLSREHLNVSHTCGSVSDFGHLTAAYSLFMPLPIYRHCCKKQRVLIHKHAIPISGKELGGGYGFVHTHLITTDFFTCRRKTLNENLAPEISHWTKLGLTHFIVELIDNFFVNKYVKFNGPNRSWIRNQPSKPVQCPSVWNSTYTPELDPSSVVCSQHLQGNWMVLNFGGTIAKIQVISKLPSQFGKFSQLSSHFMLGICSWICCLNPPETIVKMLLSSAQTRSFKLATSYCRLGQVKFLMVGPMVTCLIVHLISFSMATLLFTCLSFLPMTGNRTFKALSYDFCMILIELYYIHFSNDSLGSLAFVTQIYQPWLQVYCNIIFASEFNHISTSDRRSKVRCPLFLIFSSCLMTV
jgi:hypothetical protein